MKSRPHRAIEQRIRDSNDRHALMMRHKSENDRNTLAFRHAALGKIQSLVKTISAFCTNGCEACEVDDRGMWVNHSGKRSGVRSKDSACSKSTLKTKARYAKI